MLSELSIIKKSGCRARLRGDRLLVSKIPTWQVYQLVVKHQHKLRKLAIVKDVFKTLTPIKMKQDDDKCAFCMNAHSIRCPYGESNYRIPAATFRDGCEHFKKNNSVYF